ncbi:hypothetical protein HXX76_011113 [Chlamydomonas incerta]|uniref:MYND-type domain-containing protein n=1 Tax=Chlamydomonas incerta TaxID=51695 RepID=A0A835SQA9_CHLIN|nr:hypothetical protein HXX76_011113 [Chlamydomonas incerta]|eukprot:KAG2429347.1 hypothetical protein HXX76_011113 [Chlamydomonas incerta]
MVTYCGREHQAADWPQHKSECATFKRLGLKARFYNDEQMLAMFPLKDSRAGSSTTGAAGGGSEGSDAAGPATDVNDPAFVAALMSGSMPQQPGRPVPSGSVCGLCAKGGALTTTSCCQQPVCNNSHRYRIGTYSRNFCLRSHDRYTLCGSHGQEGCNTRRDWRDCNKCTREPRNGGSYDTANRLWLDLNTYNFCPLLEKDVPRHSLCSTCDSCGGKYVSRVEGSATTGQGTICTRCSEGLFGGGTGF